MARPFATAFAATFALAGALALGWWAISGAGGRPVAGLLPDLRMAQVGDVQLERADDGRLLLRFTAIIVNVGTGPMEVVATRQGDELGRGVQRILDVDGVFSDLASDAAFFWAGDGHDHWHVRDLQGYRVESLGDAEATAVSEKHGFCLFDNIVDEAFEERAADSAVYQCPSSQGASSIRMGLSVGWRDIYPAVLPNQYIDISDLPEGRYRLWAEADPSTTSGRTAGSSRASRTTTTRGSTSSSTRSPKRCACWGQARQPEREALRRAENPLAPASRIVKPTMRSAREPAGRASAGAAVVCGKSPALGAGVGVGAAVAATTVV